MAIIVVTRTNLLLMYTLNVFHCPSYCDLEYHWVCTQSQSALDPRSCSFSKVTASLSITSDSGAT